MTSVRGRCSSYWKPYPAHLWRFVVSHSLPRASVRLPGFPARPGSRTLCIRLGGVLGTAGKWVDLDGKCWDHTGSPLPWEAWEFYLVLLGSAGVALDGRGKQWGAGMQNAVSLALTQALARRG